jgi:hypothetical protein
MSRVAHLFGRSAATLICVAGVPALVVTLVRWLFDVRISAFRPLLNDEVTFWHQVLTFSRAGFHGGYYTLGEVTNPSGFTPFGLHGPGFPVLYGTIGALAGWQRHDIVVLNLIAISTAAAVWVLLSRISTPRLLLSGLLLVTFWPLPYWAPTGMQESLHHAGAILMGGPVCLRAPARAEDVDRRHGMDCPERARVHQTFVADADATLGVGDLAREEPPGHDRDCRGLRVVVVADCRRVQPNDRTDKELLFS